MVFSVIKKTCKLTKNTRIANVNLMKHYSQTPKSKSLRKVVEFVIVKDAQLRFKLNVELNGVKF